MFIRSFSLFSPAIYSRFSPIEGKFPQHISSSGTNRQFPLLILRTYTDLINKREYPLHNAVKKGNFKRVQELVKTDIFSVNKTDLKGDRPLIIALKQRNRQKRYPIAIIHLLLEYGACLLQKDREGKNGFHYLSLHVNDKKRKITVESAIDSQGIKQSIQGCSNCPGCYKKIEGKTYDPEFKAKVALKGLTTPITSFELSKKYEIQPWEAIKWRDQARMGLVSFFKNKVLTDQEIWHLEEQIAAKVIHRPDLELEEVKIVQHKINLIKANPKFQNNPQKFIDEWHQTRGHAQTFITTEEIAFQFFTILYDKLNFLYKKN